MKVKELIKLLKRSNPEDTIGVLIKSNNRYGQSSYANIESIYNGFDWDTGVTYIISNVDLCTKEKH